MLEQRLMLDAWYVSSVTDPMEDGSPLHPFDSVQEAIDAADDGDSVNVLVGTYTEDLTIDKELTFQGAGAISVTLEGRHIVTASNVAFNDFAFETGDVAVEIDHSAAAGDLTDIGVYDCVFELDDGEIGIKIGGNGLSDNSVSNIVIADTTFNGPAGGNSNPFRVGGAPAGAGNLDLAVSSLAFTGNTVVQGSIPIQLQDKDVSDILFDDNDFTDTEGVVYVWGKLDSPTGVLTNFTFSNNTVDNTGATAGYGLGFDLYDKYTDANIPDGEITITGNTFTEVGVVDLAGWGLTGLFGTVSILSDSVNLDTAAVRAANTFDRVAGVVGGNDLYDQIQPAIDTATDGDTVLVGNGVYTGDLAIDNADMTLMSENGLDFTRINLVDGVGIAIGGGADNLMLGGVASGFEVYGGAGTTFVVELANAPAGVTIQDNDFYTTGNATMGVSIGAAGATDLSIIENMFVTEDGDGAIWGPDVVNVTVTENLFSAGGAPASGYAVQFSGVTGTSVIDNNEIDNFANGILISNGTGTSGLAITNNIVTNGTNGIRFAQYSPGANGDMTTVTMTGNYIQNNTTGLLIGNGANVLASNFTFTSNHMSGNTTAVDNQHATETLDASGNWYGTVTAGNVAALIGGSVDYTPWLNTGTDVNATAAGFQGDFSVLNVDDDSTQVGSDGPIQEGINLVTASTVKIWPGTYTEDLAINKSVTLQPGTPGGVDIIGRHVITASGVAIIGEYAGDANEWIVLTASGNVAVEIDQTGGDISDIVIQHVIFDLGTSGDIGVNIGGNAASDNSISNLEFTASQFYGPGDMISNPIRIGGFFGGGSHLAVAVTDLTFAGNQVDRGSIPIQLADKDVSDLLFAGNTFTNTDGALYVWTQDDTPTGVLSGLVFTENDLSGSNSYGVGIDVFDKYTDANFGSGIAINYNDLSNIAGAYGFGGVGILSTGLTSFVLDAEMNWWGDAKGPDHATNPHVAGGGSTTGSPVTDNVDFTPWYATATTTSATQNVTVMHGAALAYSDTIQGAIDAAVAGDTIDVSDGTYVEDLVIDKALTLQSVNGYGVTGIDLVDGVGIDIQADNVTIGTAGKGFSIDESAAATTFLIQLTNGPADATIAYNRLDTTGNPSMGVSVGAAGAAGLTINNNIFLAGDLGDGSIWGPDVVDVTVSDNTFTGPAAQAASGYAVQFSGVTGTSLISGNTIDNYANGILISNGTGTSGLTIDDNTVTDSTNGVRFAQYSPGANGDMTTVAVTSNDVWNNTTGILIGDGANVLASNFTIAGNRIEGNTTGLDNQHATEAVTAERNWWGHATGADHASNPHGTGQGGDAVSDNVDFTPWYATDTTTAAREFVSVEHNPIIAYSDTIQGAVDAALAGDTLTASDGTYTEDVTVNKADLTLQSVNGSGSTTIQLVDGVGISLEGAADGFTLGGVGAGFTILGGAGTTFLVQLANAPAGVTIAYNSLSTAGNASMGVSVGAAGAEDLTISNNSFTAFSGDGAIWGPEVVDVLVTDNTFAGSGAYAIQFSGVTVNDGASEISGNSVTGYGNGILISNGAGTSNLSIARNTVTGGTNGIRFAEYTPGAAGMLTDVTVTENVVTGNAVGVLVGDGAHLSPNDIQISNNNLSGNTVAVNNQHGDAVDASANWWGVTSADDVFDLRDGWVDHTPWLDSGTDTEPGTPGFQGDFSYLHVNDDSVQVGAVGRIQEAVDLADGSTVNVWDGEYNENVVVDKPDVLLQSENGPAFTVIRPGAGVGIDVQANGDNFALGGSDAHGFDLVSGTGTTFLIQLVNAPSDVTISHNWIDTTDDASMGVSVGAAGAVNLTIAYNFFRTEDVGDGAIWGPSVANVVVSENTFTGPEPLAAGGYAVQFSGVTGTSEIANNFIADWGMGIVISNGPGTAGLLIDGNALSENTSGIRLTQYSPGANGDMTTVTVTNNQLFMNDIGLRVDDGANVLASTFTVTNNDIVFNATFGVRNSHATELLTAENNWWGDNDGPFHATNPGGDGDAVSDNVDFTPWLGAALMPATDLVVDYYSIALPTDAVPGDEAKIRVTVTNRGYATASGDVFFEVFLSTLPYITPDAVSIGTVEVGISLSAGRSRRYTIRTMVPYDIDPDLYELIAEVDSEDDFDEIREDNNTVRGPDDIDVTRRFGDFAGRTRVAMTLEDPLGVPVTFSLRGGGWGEAEFDGDNGYFEVTVQGTSDRSKVYVKTPRGETTTLDEFDALNDCRYLDARTSGLIGAMNFWGAADVARIRLGEVTTGDLMVTGLLKRLDAGSWGAGSITADVLSRLNVYGNSEADLTILNAGGEDYGLRTARIRGDLGCLWDITGSLGRLTVDGWLNDSTLRVTGDIKSLTVGGIDDSTVFAGVNPAVPAGELPDPATAFVNPSQIRRLKVKGLNGDAFMGSYVAASEIGSVSLVNVRLNNGGWDFGLSAEEIGSLRLRQDDARYTWPDRWLADPIDLLVWTA